MRIRPYRTFIAAGALCAAAIAGCTDLVVEPKSTVTAANIFNDPSSYRAFMAKIYAGLATSGQEGPAGRPDIVSNDEGFTQYLRLYWQMQELPTDAAAIAWNDAGVQELNTQIWSTSNGFLVSMYYRVYFQVGLVNEFLRETTDEKLSSRGVAGQLRTDIEQYRAEARFLRALSYWHGIDLFGSIPLVEEDYPLGAAPPQQATRAELFAFVESELLDIMDDLPAPGSGEYGRADQGAAAMVLAKLYLNAEVYTGTARYADVITALQAILSGPYALDDVYAHMFLADNHTSPELIFSVPQDGLFTRSFGGTTFLTHAPVGGNMNAANYGVDFGWWGLRIRPEGVALYTDPADTRSSLLFTSGQTLTMSSLTNFQNGYAYEKYQNVTSTGAPGSNPAHPDTDYPMFRLADAYLMYAEAVLRGGGGSASQALTYVNLLRQRAYGGSSGDITAGELTLDFILDERGRELMWEGHRRQDLIRYDQFTANGVWAWKGGTLAGAPTETFRALYPLPASELLANPNLTQNPGYGN